MIGLCLCFTAAFSFSVFFLFGYFNLKCRLISDSQYNSRQAKPMVCFWETVSYCVLHWDICPGLNAATKIRTVNFMKIYENCENSQKFPSSLPEKKKKNRMRPLKGYDSQESRIWWKLQKLRKLRKFANIRKTRNEISEWHLQKLRILQKLQNLRELTTIASLRKNPNEILGKSRRELRTKLDGEMQMRFKEDLNETTKFAKIARPSTKIDRETEV